MAEYNIGDRVVVKSTTGSNRIFGEGVIDSEPVDQGYFVKIHPEFPAVFYYTTEIVGYVLEEEGP